MAGAAPPPPLKHVIVTEPVKGLNVPVFVCSELQNEKMLPVYFNKRDLARAWVQTGRDAQSFTTEKRAAVELSSFVEDMQKPVYSLWHTVNFLPSGAAVAVLSVKMCPAVFIASLLMESLKA